LKLAVNIDFKKNHPRAYKVVKKINFSNTDLNKMSNYVDTDGLDIPSAAQKWLEENKKKWAKWIENE
jgi:ABC-type proline/glycine betaine transport system substrate-binding protein